MKIIIRVLLCMPLLLLSGCWGYGTESDDVSVFPAQQDYTPVVMNREAFEAAVTLMPQQAVAKSGKIYIKDNLLFVNDVNKGFHIYKYNSAGVADPVAFLNIPGATDVAMRGNTLYINQATDLVTLNYSNNAITLIKRSKQVFPQKQAPDNSYADLGENDIIVDWQPL